MGLETDALQEALQQPVKRVKELLSSLAAPVPTALSLQTVFVNEEYVASHELPQPLITGTDQSDGARESHDNAEVVIQQEVDSAFAAATMETKCVC